MIRFSMITAALVTLSLISGIQAQPKTEPKPAASSALTDATLKEMLELLGYEPREEKTKDGLLYWIDITTDGLKYNVSVQISPNREKIWTITPLADIKDEHLKMADRWVKLAELNDAIGPCYFRYNAQYKRLYLSRAMDNRGVTAKILRDHLERHVDRCVETKKDWMVSTWTDKPPTVADLGK